MPALIVLAEIFGLAAYAIAHTSLIRIQGSNHVVGHAFGVDLNGKYPRVPGPPGDAGGDSGVFQTGTNNPSPACGETPELGPIDIVGWLSQAEGYGLPAAYPNGSIVAQAFQVNRDGGGPMSCEYNEDATAKSFKPMTMILNHSGNKGVWGQERVNETVVIHFPAGARCTGGWTQTACIIRCRTGVNKRFGGCFAARLSGTRSPSYAVSSSARVTTGSSAGGKQRPQSVHAKTNRHQHHHQHHHQQHHHHQHHVHHPHRHHHTTSHKHKHMTRSNVSSATSAFTSQQSSPIAS